jgi:hypothetical protein
MLKSRVILTGIAVAAAAVAGSAFTAANSITPSGTNVAGYGEATVTGASVNNIAYTPATDASKLASVVFTSTTGLGTDTAATMFLTNAGVAAPSSASTCVIGAAAAGETPITCTLTAAVAFADFDAVGLTVVSE